MPLVTILVRMGYLVRRRLYTANIGAIEGYYNVGVFIDFICRFINQPYL